MPNEPIPDAGSQEADRQWLLLQPAFSGRSRRRKKQRPEEQEEDLLMPTTGEPEEEATPLREKLRARSARRKVSVMNNLEQE